MTESKMMRLGQIAAKLNIGRSTIIAFLKSRGFEVEDNPNTRISPEQQNLLTKEFQASIATKKEASGLHFAKTHNEKIVIEANDKKNTKVPPPEDKEIQIKSALPREEKKREELDLRGQRLQGTKVVGHIDLDNLNKPKEEATNTEEKSNNNHRRRRRRERDRQRRDEKNANPTTTNNTSNTPQVLENTTIEEKPKTITAPQPEPQMELIEAKAERLQGLTVLGKIELPGDKKKKTAKPQPVASSDDGNLNKRKRKRKRNRKSEDPNAPKTTNTTRTEGTNNQTANSSNQSTNTTTNNNNNRNNNNRSSQGGNSNNNSARTQNNSGGQQNNNNRNNNPNNSSNNASGNQNRDANGPRNNNSSNNNNNRRPAPAPVVNKQPDEKEIQEQIKSTLARLSGNAKSGSKQQIRRQKKDRILARKQEALLKEEQEANILKVTEFISANELANLMGVSVNEVISKCLGMGMFVSINHRLDADAITVIADEFGYDVEFVSAEQEVEIELEEPDNEKHLKPRSPIVTIMGHVDHGKTSLLDYIRKSKVTEQEAGGITQHIGAYSVKTKSGKQITFLDTPGHEAFTAMRARGAKITDIAIIVIAADDSVMPQTREAINHAQLAGVPIVFAFNKIDKADSKPEKIKEELAQMNLLVEDWGGKYQSQEISAKKGIGIEELLEKVLLEAEMLELKADPTKRAVGTVIEAKLDKGRGYVSTVLVRAGTLKKGDVILAGANYGRVKAMNDDLGKLIKEAGPSTPVQVLGLDGAPQAGDKFHVLGTEKEARDIAAKRAQLIREQSIRTTVRPTLGDIGRRIALGNFKQLNIILKGDVDGSIEALADSLLRLSTEEVEVRIIQKAVGQITESDVLLSAASDAIIIGFQVRPSVSARKLAETEQVEIRLYSIIYDAINEVRAAMEGMLAPTIEEVITGSAEVRDVFKISKVGTVAGSYVLEGHIKRNSKVRLIRNGIVVYGKENEGEILALKRFKDDVAEVKQGFECGISIKNFNDLKVGDIIEAYEQKEIKRKL